MLFHIHFKARVILIIEDSTLNAFHIHFKARVILIIEDSTLNAISHSF